MLLPVGPQRADCGQRGGWHSEEHGWEPFEGWCGEHKWGDMARMQQAYARWLMAWWAHCQAELTVGELGRRLTCLTRVLTLEEAGVLRASEVEGNVVQLLSLPTLSPCEHFAWEVGGGSILWLWLGCDGEKRDDRQHSKFVVARFGPWPWPQSTTLDLDIKKLKICNR